MSMPAKQRVFVETSIQIARVLDHDFRALAAALGLRLYAPEET